MRFLIVYFVNPTNKKDVRRHNNDKNHRHCQSCHNKVSFHPIVCKKETFTTRIRPFFTELIRYEKEFLILRARRRRRQKEKTSVLIVFLRSAPLLAVLTHKRVDEKSRQNDNYESVQNILPHRIPLWSVPSNALLRAQRVKCVGEPFARSL